jgi:hypothetical protein
METTRLTEEARVLARELLRHHEQMCRQLALRNPEEVTDGMVNQSIIFYGDLCDRAGVPFLTRSVGHFLAEIAEWRDENSWPPLNALAVNSESKEPGDGNDEAAGCALLRWPNDVRKCIAFHGYPKSASI